MRPQVSVWQISLYHSIPSQYTVQDQFLAALCPVGSLSWPSNEEVTLVPTRASFPGNVSPFATRSMRPAGGSVLGPDPVRCGAIIPGNLRVVLPVAKVDTNTKPWQVTPPVLALQLYLSAYPVSPTCEAPTCTFGTAAGLGARIGVQNGKQSVERIRTWWAQLTCNDLYIAIGCRTRFENGGLQLCPRGNKFSMCRTKSLKHILYPFVMSEDSGGRFSMLIQTFSWRFPNKGPCWCAVPCRVRSTYAGWRDWGLKTQTLCDNCDTHAGLSLRDRSKLESWPEQVKVTIEGFT